MKTVNIIIPCYNEEESIPQLFTKLKELERVLVSDYEPLFVFVDDGSMDKTHALILENKCQLTKSLLLKHENNKNLGAAIKTGIFNSPEADYVAFLDSDCTYEPEIVIKLLKSLSDGADFATVSPYHPKGEVQGVPKWRLALSKSLSNIYRILLWSDIYTYTAMVRAIKYQHIKRIISSRDDFSFMAESLIKAIRLKLKIVEVPTTLKVRMFGVSKMNIIKTIKSQLLIVFKIVTNQEI